MKTILLAVLLALSLASHAAPMTNDDVIKMVQGGLGEAIVLQAIDGAEPAFDTSPDGLVKLKQGGVGDAVIQRILGGRNIAAPRSAAPPACVDCGTVTGVREIRKAGQGTGLGAVAGGVLGGVLGRSIGGSNNRTAGTVVGAAGGAVAGHMIEKNAREGHSFEIGVRFDDGHSRVFTQETHPSLQQGSRIRLVNGALTPL